MATMTIQLSSMDAPEGLEDGEHYALYFEEWGTTGAVWIKDGKIDEDKLIASAIRCRSELGFPFTKVVGLDWETPQCIFRMRVE